MFSNKLDYFLILKCIYVDANVSGIFTEFYDNLEHKSAVTLWMLLRTFLSGLNTEKPFESNNQ